MDWHQQIHSDPEVLVGKPVVRGTRLCVDFILSLFAQGWTEQQVLENYPTLSTESMRRYLPLQLNAHGMKPCLPCLRRQADALPLQ